MTSLECTITGYARNDKLTVHDYEGWVNGANYALGIARGILLLTFMRIYQTRRLMKYDMSSQAQLMSCHLKSMTNHPTEPPPNKCPSGYPFITEPPSVIPLIDSDEVLTVLQIAAVFDIKYARIVYGSKVKDFVIELAVWLEEEKGDKKIEKRVRKWEEEGEFMVRREKEDERIEGWEIPEGWFAVNEAI
ncbi:hypothetical protein ABW19_dt0207205 [Dactylella cylindrospora]|nr:hypothetical protein ABW19_dt0207205 [Dactylella cylindrospora]